MNELLNDPLHLRCKRAGNFIKLATVLSIILTLFIPPICSGQPENHNQPALSESYTTEQEPAYNPANHIATVFNIKASRPWQRSWWFITLLVLTTLLFILLLYFLYIGKIVRHRALLKQKIHKSTSELQQANLELLEHQKEISKKNEELARHYNHLEKLVEKRTADLELALSKAEEADKIKTSFLANMSHEIRTPMNAIVGFATLLRDKKLSTDVRDEYINIINRNCDSLLVLINDILDISKIEANKIEIYKTPFSVDKALEELEQFFCMNAPEETEVKFIRSASNIIINNDPTRFRQIVANMLTNASKYTEKGHIHFGFELLNDYIRFYVSDTGVGISKSEYANIFNPFKKIEGSRTKLYRGAGLGLAICKSLVEQMGGKIWVESEPGKGSTFFFTLPFTPRAMPPPEPDKTSRRMAGLKDWSRITILVAEDEPANYYYIEKVFKPTGARILWAKDGKESIEYIKENDNYNINLILMDLKMPVMNGIDAFREIQKMQSGIPVIAQTAYAQDADKKEALATGFTDYIIKPIKPVTLIRTVQKYL